MLACSVFDPCAAEESDMLSVSACFQAEEGNIEYKVGFIFLLGRAAVTNFICWGLK